MVRLSLCVCVCVCVCLQTVCPQPDPAVPPQRRVGGGGACAGGSVALLRGSSVNHRSCSESAAPITAAPITTAPSPGSAPPSPVLSLCIIINPLYSSPTPLSPKRFASPYQLNLLFSLLRGWLVDVPTTLPLMS